MTETQGLNDVNEELERYRNALVKMETQWKNATSLLNGNVLN